MTLFRALAVAATIVGAGPAWAGPVSSIAIPIDPASMWWVGVVEDGYRMPMTEPYRVNVWANNDENQVEPLLISSAGDVVWSSNPFSLAFDQNELRVKAEGGDIFQARAGDSLRDAFLYANRRFFHGTGTTPDAFMFERPQYNTWIELQYEQSQAGVLNYAQGIRAHGFPPGVLMIDDNWQEDYGRWDFDARRFPDPKALVQQLHALDFKVMLWVCPFVSADSQVYRELSRQGLLLKDASGQPAIVRWWNGASALLDLSNPQTADWFKAQLDRLRGLYGVDGFKFDGGDSRYYEGLVGYRAISPNEHTELYGKIGLSFPLNEYRAMWKMGRQPLAERLSDKTHSWSDLGKLIPDMTLAGLMGYPFSCPDMIGGGEVRSFSPGATIDQELIVRSAQCQALMPMMQFSVAPWRVLDERHLAAVLAAVKIREANQGVIMALVEHAAETGEPIVRNLEYEFPHRGYGRIADEFMLGSRLLVAPILERNASRRTVVLPPGRWRDASGRVFEGPSTIEAPAGLGTLNYFGRL